MPGFRTAVARAFAPSPVASLIRSSLVTPTTADGPGGFTYLQLGSSRYRSCRGRGANSKSFAVWERQKNLSSSGEKQLPKLTCQPEILEGSRPGTSRAVGENAELDGIIQNVASKIVNDGHMLVSDIGWLNKWCSEMGRAGSYSQATSGEGPLLNHNRQRFAVGEGLHSNRVSSNRRLCFRETEFCAQRQRRRNIRRSSQGLAGRDEANATTRQLRASYRTAGKSLRKSECVVADAVTVEPVSAEKFPWYQGKIQGKNWWRH
jgi:hypothetical protein